MFLNELFYGVCLKARLPETVPKKLESLVVDHFDPQFEAIRTFELRTRILVFSVLSFLKSIYYNYMNP